MAQGPAATAAAENMLTQAIGKLFAVAEDYPELRATENFQQLQAQLEETESKIAVSRQIYNDAVLSYDNALETVPTNIVAGIFRLQAARVLRGRGRRGARSAAGPVLRALRVAAALAAGALLLAGSAQAQSKSFSLPDANVVVTIADDGSLDVSETILFVFNGPFSRRLPRHSAPRGRVDLERLRRGGRPGVHARRVGRARLERRPGDLRHRGDRRPLPDRLALQRLQRGALVHDQVQAERPRGRLRRRRRRELPGVGRRVAGAAGPALGAHAPPRAPRAASSSSSGATRCRCAATTPRARSTRRCAPRTSRRSSSSRCASSSRATSSRRPRARRCAPGTRSQRIVAEEKSEARRVRGEPAEDQRRARTTSAARC